MTIFRDWHGALASQEGKSQQFKISFLYYEDTIFISLYYKDKCVSLTTIKKLISARARTHTHNPISLKESKYSTIAKLQGAIRFNRNISILTP